MTARRPSKMLIEEIRDEVPIAPSLSALRCQIFMVPARQALENVSTYPRDHSRPWPKTIVIMGWGVNKRKALWLKLVFDCQLSFVKHTHHCQSLSSIDQAPTKP